MELVLHGFLEVPSKAVALKPLSFRLAVIDVQDLEVTYSQVGECTPHHRPAVTADLV